MKRGVSWAKRVGGFSEPVGRAGGKTPASLGILCKEALEGYHAQPSNLCIPV